MSNQPEAAVNNGEEAATPFTACACGSTKFRINESYGKSCRIVRPGVLACKTITGGIDVWCRECGAEVDPDKIAFD